LKPGEKYTLTLQVCHLVSCCSWFMT
jgi:hypothetical protein